ncbi:MAG: SEL1-like repeat protein [Muribaculaceae bacterium]|nr:SEL1-like repeat protein [Muribaculaceae bacterium]
MKKLFITIGIALMAGSIPALAAKPVQTKAEAIDSIKNVIALAGKGDADAQNRLGTWYYTGKHVDQDYRQALEWWSRAAKQGHNEAVGNMGISYQYGRGTDRDSLMAVKLYEKSLKGGNPSLLERHEKMAQKGEPFSNMLLNEVYRKGIGVEKDTEKANKYLAAVADKGDLIAQRDLALIYLNAKNPAAAAPWLKRGADAGNKTCRYYYGQLLLNGNGVKQDKKAGANYMLLAARDTFPQAMYYLGNLYMDGEGLAKSPEQAVEWYQKGAANGEKRAMWNLSRCYREGVGTPVNYFKSAYWLAEVGADNNFVEVKKLLRDTIPNSPFVKYLEAFSKLDSNSFPEAMKDFKAMEKAVSTDSKIMQGFILMADSYNKKNYKKGLKLLEEAAKENPMAEYFLGALYENGQGVDRDMKKAAEYYQKAADRGFGLAMGALGDMYYEGRGVDTDFAKACELYEQAYTIGELYEGPAGRYATCLAEGKGVTQNKEKAEKVNKINHKKKFQALLDLMK